MSVYHIPIISVSYNAPELIEGLLSTIRRYYQNPIYIIDGSDAEHYPGIQLICDRYQAVQCIHFDFNIHHGPGLAWAFNHLPLTGQVLVIDSDVLLINNGFLEDLSARLSPEMYAVGSTHYVDRLGFNAKPNQPSENNVLYLHPALMLCNIDVVKQWPMPIKHGSPMIETMIALNDQQQTQLLGQVDWLSEDFNNPNVHNYIQHEWQGTVKSTGGYHLEEWVASLQQKKVKEKEMLDKYNHDLLNLMPKDARGIVEVGCSNGALAHAYKQLNKSCFYTGIEIDDERLAVARNYCDEAFKIDIEAVDHVFFERYKLTHNCWVFGDVLEHLRDPWSLLVRIRESLPKDGCVVISLPNVQHWTIQAKLSVGDWRYEDFGLLDRTHIRFFTRTTMLEMIAQAGFVLEEGYPRVYNPLTNPHLIQSIRTMAEVMGQNPDQAIADANAFQFVARIRPV